MKFIYGLYHVQSNDVAKYMKMARAAGITHFDTAQLYGNERACSEACLPTDIVTTKIYDGSSAGQIKKRIVRSINRFETRIVGTSTHPKINCFLLHRRMPNECWGGLVQHISELYPNEIVSLGVSNYDYNSLVDLISYCEQNGLRKPDVHQMEVHPFVDCDPLIQYCQAQGIRVEGHTILAQGMFFNHLPLCNLSKKYQVSPAAIMTTWALSKGIDICINTRSPEHLSELIQARELILTPEDIALINTWHQTSPYRFYNKMGRVPQTTNEMNDELVKQIIDQLQRDLTGDYPSSLCEEVPITGDGYRTIGRLIATQLYPDLISEHALLKLRQEIKRIRTYRTTQRKVELQRKKGMSCCVIKRQEGEYSDSIMQPRPMPVDVTNPSEFIPFFEFLKSSESAPEADTIFVRGAMFPDGRMDLCKQVVGPTSIQALCETVNQSIIVRHFLLGNNVALQDNQEAGAHAFASVMANNEKPIETWYLAGNCIGSIGISIMAPALYHNTQCKALWLKRNPIGPIGAISLNSMLRINQHLVLLDLHNCALGNEGLQNLLGHPSEIKALKHLYLDANAIETTEPIIEWCKVGRPVTISVSINRLGDDEIMCLAHTLKGNPTLKRLCLASTHLGNTGVHHVVEMALSCPRLISLNLGCYKSTADLGEWPGNLFDDDVVPDLCRLVAESNSLHYLNTSGSKMSRDGIDAIPRLSHLSMDLGAGPIHHVHNKSQLRIFKHPKRVVHIDSIYRGKI
jgi:diketogulonate reductase-like aldo/keto reductase